MMLVSLALDSLMSVWSEHYRQTEASVNTPSPLMLGVTPEPLISAGQSIPGQAGIGARALTTLREIINDHLWGSGVTKSTFM